jgi:hypothetical protein
MKLLPLLMLVAAVMLIGVSQASGAFGTPTPDVDGANDVPGQKDLSSQNVDYAGLPNTIKTQWNWDELKTSGNNTLDACSLLDSDGDGNANFAVCGTTKGTAENPIVTTTTLYSCGDTRADRCSSQLGIITGGTSACTSAVSATDPFGGNGKLKGANYPDDLQATCNLVLDDFGLDVSTLVLINTCSYPSQQPNSDPSDCVLKTIPFVTPVLSTTPANTPTFSELLTDSLDVQNANAGGTATFTLYASLADCQNSANALFTSGNVSVSGGLASTTGFSVSPSVETTYHWLVTYSGDLTNHINPATTICGDETSKVTPPAVLNDGV